MTADEIVHLIFLHHVPSPGQSPAREAAAQGEIKAAIQRVVEERDEALREHDEALVGLAGYARDILKLEKSLEDMERKLQEARAELEAMTLDRDDARVGRSRAWAARDLAREGRNLAQDGCLAREEERAEAQAECLRLRSVRAELERLVGSL